VTSDITVKDFIRNEQFCYLNIPFFIKFLSTGRNVSVRNIGNSSTKYWAILDINELSLYVRHAGVSLWSGHC